MKPILVVVLSLLLGQAMAQGVSVDKFRIREMVTSWSDATNNADVEALRKLYAERLLFYGKKLQREECIAAKATLLSKHQQFHQTISGSVALEAFENSIVKCSFTKEVVIDGKVAQYKSYLLVDVSTINYIIVGESDLTTDRNLEFSLDLGDKVALHEASKKETMVQSATTQGKTNVPEAPWLFSALALAGLFVAFIGFRSYIRKKESTVRRRRHGPTPPPVSNQDILKDKGDRFERYIVKKFDRRYFELMDWRSDKGVDGLYPKSNGDPDLVYKFHYRSVNEIFAVECKYRKNLFHGYFVVSVAQLNRYFQYQSREQRDVYIALGLGGTPENPDAIYLLPLALFQNINRISRYDLEYYRKDKKHNFFFKSDLRVLT